MAKAKNPSTERTTHVITSARPHNLMDVALTLGAMFKKGQTLIEPKTGTHKGLGLRGLMVTHENKRSPKRDLQLTKPLDPKP